MDVFILKCLKKLVFAVKRMLTYGSWDPYRPEDFLFPTVLPTQTKKSPDLSRKIPGTIFSGKSPKIPYDTYNSLKKHHN
jgi:hypothetical protein